MSRSVLFNGAQIVRAGAATKIDASQFASFTLNGLGTIGLIGEADGGQPRTVQSFFTPQAVKAFYKSGDLVEAAAMAADPSNDNIIQTGAQSIVCYKVNNSAASTASYAGTFAFTSLGYGVLQNTITVNSVAGTGSSRIVTISTLDDFGALMQEVSPELGGSGYFTIQYTGAGSAATITITATQLTTTCTGAAGDNLTLSFSDYTTLSALIQAILVNGKYTCTALVTNAPSFDPSNLDALAAADIKTALTTIYARNFDLANWINTYSAIISCTLTKGQTGPTAVMTAALPLTGGTRGTSANSDWVNAFAAMRNYRVNQIVPLASADATTAQGTFTIASIVASAVAHAKLMSSTAGRNECQAWAGVNMTKTNLKTQANLQNNCNLELFGQKSKRARTSDGAIVFFPEWSTAVIAAGMRCGAPLGEPLTWKFANVLGVSEDASWSDLNDDDVKDLILNGVAVLFTVPGKGFKFEKLITTYTQSNNDAYAEETIVQIWKLVAYNLRTELADELVGRGGTLDRVSTVPTIVNRVMQPLKDAKAITDSVVNGVRLNAWRNVTWSLNGDVLTVSLIVTPTPGINYVLTTIVLVPAQISGSAAA